MSTKKLLFVVLLAATVICNDTTSICKLMPDFGGIGNTTAGALPKDSKFCKNLNSTCCSKADFEKMYTVWEGNTKGTSLLKERSREMNDTMTLVNYLQKADSDLIWLSNKIKKAGINADPACSTPSYIHRQMDELELIKTALTTFKQTGTKCWEYTKNLMNGLMCAACDHSAQDFIDYKKKELFISSKECSTFLSSCGDHLKAIQAVYFYFNNYHRLTYCNEKGKFSVQKVPDFMSFPKNVKMAIDSCLNNNNQDDCVAVCQSQLGFTTMVNYEYLNKQKLMDQKTDIEKFVKTLNQQPQEKPQSKRVLQGVSDSVAETLKRINGYTIRVSKVGLDLYKYTENNQDGYTDINVKEALSSNLVFVAFFWTILATFI